jgi:hypothetical protein
MEKKGNTLVNLKNSIVEIVDVSELPTGSSYVYDNSNDDFDINLDNHSK